MTSRLAVTNLAESSPNADEAVNRFPRPLSSFEIATLIHLVTSTERRLATVTGPGGIGKTRLALEVTRRCHEQFRDGVMFPGLADGRDQGLVAGSVALALRAPEAQRSSPAERLRCACQGMEQLLDVAPLFSEIRTWCPAGKHCNPWGSMSSR